MDSDTYDQVHVPPETVGDAAHYLLENQDAIVALHEGVPLYVELPAVGRAVDQLHRARACRATAPPAAPSRRRSRPAPRSRCRCSSRPARRSRSTPATGRYLGRVERLRSTVVPPAARRASARWTCCSSPSSAASTGGRRPGRPARAVADPPVNDYTVELVEGVRRAPRAHRRAAGDLRARAGRSTGCRRSTAPAADRRRSSCCGRRDVPDAVAIDEAVELPRPVHRRVARLRQRPARPACSSSSRRSPSSPPTRVISSTSRAWAGGGLVRDRRRGRLVLGGQSRARRASALSTPQVMSCSVSCARRLVVDHRERAQVVLADRQHPAVVVAALGLDRRGVPRQRPGLARPGCLQLLQVEDQPGRRSAAAPGAGVRAAAQRPARRRNRRARPAAAR